MGRLFWKFFFYLAGAIDRHTLGIGAVFWLKDRKQNVQLSTLDMSPPAAMIVESAALILRYGGQAELQAWLKKNDRHPVLVIDEQGRDFLQRPVNEDMLAQARLALDTRGEHTAVRQATAASDGQRYLLFSARSNFNPDGSTRPPA